VQTKCGFSANSTSKFGSAIPSLFAFLLNLEFAERSENYYSVSPDDDQASFGKELSGRFIDKSSALSLEEFKLSIT
jgi:hypothetical protein